jgi:hypothetical protein
MNYEDKGEIKMVFHEPGLQDNAQRITIEIAKAIFHETFCVTRKESA